MKAYLIHAFLLLTVLGTWTALKNTNKKGVNVVDGPEEFFLRRFKIDEDIRNKNATFELHLTSIDLLVAVRVDAVNKIINSITTSYLPGNVVRNETEPEKEKKKEQIVTNNQKNSGTSLPPPEIREANSFISTLLEMAWNGLCYAMRAFYDWLTFGFGGPRHINVDRFMARSITRADITWSAKGSADHMFNLDIAEMEKGIHRLNTLIPLMKMTDMGHSDNKQLPKFPTFDYFCSNPEILWDLPLQRENEDSILPSNLDTLDLLDQKCPVEDEDNYIHWPEPETPAEFATTEPERENEKEPIVTTHHNNTGISLTPPEAPQVNNSTLLEMAWNGLPPRETPRVNSSTVSEMAWNGLSCVVQSFYDWLTFGFGGPRHINVNRFAARSITSADLTWSAEESADRMFNLSIAEMEKEINRVNTSIPLMTMTNMGHSDSKQPPKFPTFDYFRSNPEILWVSPLQRENEDSVFPDNLDTVDLKEEDNDISWPQLETPAELATVGYYGMVRNITVSENNDTDNAKPERNASRSLSESTWFTTRLWNKCMAIIGWRKSSGVPVQESGMNEAAQDKWMTQVPVNKSDTETEFCTKKADTTLFTTRLRNRSVAARQSLRSHETQEKARNPTTKDIMWRESLVVDECPSKRNSKSWPLKNSQIGNPVLMDKSNTSTPVITETSLNSAGVKTQTTYDEDQNKYILPVEAEIQSSGNASNVCIKNHEIFHLGINDMTPLIFHTRDDIRLEATPVKKAKNKWMEKISINQSQICLVGSKNNSPDTNYCSWNVSRRSSESTWFTTRLWNKCKAIIGWRKSSGMPVQATRVNKVAQDKWMTQEPVSVFEICMAVSNKSHPETEFCTKKPDTTRFTTRLWNRGVAAMRRLRSNETQEKACNLTNCYWTRFQITTINWTRQVTFYVMIIFIIWLIDYYFMAFYFTIEHIKEIIRLLRFQREIQKSDLEEEGERLRQLEVEHEQAVQSSTLQREIQEREFQERELGEEPERLPKLEVEREQAAQSSTLQRKIQECESQEQRERERKQAAQSKPWKPKPRKKKRPNYCGRQQKW